MARKKPSPPTNSLAWSEALAWSKAPAGRQVSPFDISSLSQLHPPAVSKAARQSRMAMDQDPGLAMSIGWAAGIAVSSAFREGLTFLGYPYLAELSQRAEYRRASEIVAFEMTREWIEFSEKETEQDEKELKDEDEEEPVTFDEGDPAAEGQEGGEPEEEGGAALKEKKELKSKISKLEDKLEDLKVREVFRRVIEQDGFFGRGHIYVDTGDTDDRDELQKPLTRSRLKVNPDHPVMSLRTVEAVWCYPTQYNSSDPLSEDWYKPNEWLVMGKQLHSSRLITIIGREVSDLLKPAYSFGGLALSQMMKPYVDNWLRGRQSVSDLVHNFSVSGVKTDLSSILQAGVRSLMEKVEFFRNVRDNKGVMLLNKDSEEFFQVNTPLSGLDALQAQMQEHMAAVTGIPIVKLLGIQPAGLNASSEGELQSFYDWIGALQERMLRDPLTYVIDLVQLSLWGEVDDRITYRFKPLRIVEEKAEAERRKVEAEIDDIYVAMGAIDAEEVREKIAKDPEMPYGLIDPRDMPEVDTSELDGAFGDQPGGGQKANPAQKVQQQLQREEAA